MQIPIVIAAVCNLYTNSSFIRNHTKLVLGICKNVY